MDRETKDRGIAALITLVVALMILLLLFVMHISTPDRAAIAEASIPEIQTEELMMLEPELNLSTPGENNEMPQSQDAPLPMGEPEKGEEETAERIQPGKSETPAPVSEPVNTQKKSSPVKVKENSMSPEQEKRLKSMSGKFSNTTNGSKDGKNATVNGQGAVNTSGSLYGRKFKGCDTSRIEVDGKVTVKVNVRVDDDGKVVSANAISGPKAYRSICEGWARTARWSARKGAPIASGSITFTITPKGL